MIVYHNFNSPLDDVALLTELEQISDVVMMLCYAPLFVNVNPDGIQAESDLIGYNTLSSFRSLSYHVQKVFSNNIGNQTVVFETKNFPTRI